LAFTSDFVPRARYRYLTGGLEGYVNASLSYRNLSDFNITSSAFNSANGTAYCRTWDHHVPYKPMEMTQEYYIVLMSRFVFVVAYEHVVFFIIFVIHWLIPDVPKRIQDQIEREALITQRALWEVKPQDRIISNFLTRIVAENNSNTNGGEDEDKTRKRVQGLSSRVYVGEEDDREENVKYDGEERMRANKIENVSSEHERFSMNSKNNLFFIDNMAATVAPVSYNTTSFNLNKNVDKVEDDVYSDEEEEDFDDDEKDENDDDEDINEKDSNSKSSRLKKA
jgi:hypothetical protein